MTSPEETAQIDLDAAIRSGDDDRIAGVLDTIGRDGASSAEIGRIMELTKDRDALRWFVTRRQSPWPI
jgi:hypothetical protein